MLVINGLHLADETSGGRVYLVEGPMECVLVDTGAPDGTLGVGQLVSAAKRQIHEVRLILLTHAHRGHAGNAAEVRRLTGARLAASAETAELLRTPLAVPSRRRFGRRQAWPPEPIRVDEVLDPGRVLDLAGGIEVIDAPGHLPGALAFHCYGPNALLLGDAATLRHRRRAATLVPPPARWCADPAAAARTAERLSAVGAAVIGPGHGWPSVHGRLPTRLWGSG